MRNQTPPENTLEILGVPVSNLTMSDAVDRVISASNPDNGLTQVAFVNADCLNIAWTNAEYHRVLNAAPVILADGSGVRYASRMLHNEVVDNVNGTDMFPLLCERAARDNIPVYLLGARPGITDAMAERLLARFPGLPIAGHHHGFFKPDQEDALIDAIVQSGARMLFVAFGAPNQDLWIARHQTALSANGKGVGMAMGVGGLFDFMSGQMPRAPVWMRKMGIEWVFRLLQEPGRMWKRYILGNPLFLWRVRRQIKNQNKKTGQ